MQLIPFTEHDYDLLVSWIPDEAFNLLWGGPLYEWPITVEQIARHQENEEVKSFLVNENGNEIGFVELFRKSESHFRLCRVLIADESSRGRGYGKRLVQLAMNYAQQNFGATKFSLAVFESNQRAQRCYLDLGFKVISRQDDARGYQGQSWPLMQMELSV